MSADVCLLLEGTYPYVSGGVSVWVHDLIQAQPHLTFHLTVLVPNRTPRPMRFKLPANVVGLNEVVLQEPCGEPTESRRLRRLMTELEPALTRLLRRGGWGDLRTIVEALSRHAGVATRANLMNSMAAWGMIMRMYQQAVPNASFLDYFWTWRALAGGLFSVLLAEIPPASVYHAVSTGYAGLLLGRAVAQTGAPGLLTEHGIYINERRVEIAMAEWLHDDRPSSLAVENLTAGLREVWIDAFMGFSHVCYEASSVIVTLYRGNQELQRRDGAPPQRLVVIPNGIDCKRFSRAPRDPTSPPTIALVGRLVPIKDIKTFVRAADILRRQMPNVRAVVLGGADEDPAYARECSELVEDSGLGDVIHFAGQVNLTEWLSQIDVMVLTSISEAQPLVLLEAGAAGIPAVATDVGSCREILLGDPQSERDSAPGGFITPLSNPLATARACASLLLDPHLRYEYGSALADRVRRRYDKGKLDEAYRSLYARLISDYRRVDPSPRAAAASARVL